MKGKCICGGESCCLHEWLAKKNWKESPIIRGNEHPLYGDLGAMG